MKRLLLSLALALAVPAIAGAQQASAPPMRPAMQQMMKLHEQFRVQVLGALTPAHKQLLASVVGNLAIAEHPDYRAAVAQLDAALSDGEKTAILAAAQQQRAQMKQLMQQIRSMNPNPHPRPSGKHMHKHHAPDAGAILLALGGGRGGMMMRWHH
jgi:hypothetical protein